MPLKPKDAPSLNRFNWEDPFSIETQLSEDERTPRAMLRKLTLKINCSRVSSQHFAMRKLMYRFSAEWEHGLSWVSPFPKNMAAAVLLMSPTVWWRAKWSVLIVDIGR